MGQDKKKSKQWQVSPERVMSLQESKQLLKYCEDRYLADLAKGRKTWVKHYMLVDLALKSGLRVSEIRDLKVSDLNLSKTPNIHVQHGKGKKSRHVPIDLALKKHLKEYIDNFDLSPDDFLLKNHSGKQISRQGLEKNIYAIVEKAGLPRYSIHCFRHTYATMHYRKNKNLHKLRKNLGHSRIETTTVYLHTSKEDALEMSTGLYE